MATKVTACLAGQLLICLIFLFEFAHGARKDIIELRADVPELEEYETQIFNYNGSISLAHVARNHTLADIYEEGWSVFSMTATTSWGLEGYGGFVDFTDGGLGFNYWACTWFMPANLSATYEMEAEIRRPIPGSRKQSSE